MADTQNVDHENTEYRNILTRAENRVGYIALNRPEALNALNRALVGELVTAARAFDDDPGIGAIVVTGSEKAFAAGADIKEMADQSYVDMFLDDPFARFGEFGRLRTPVIAAVAGYALGGGCELAMMCDIILAADTAVFGQPEINLGVIPGIGGTQRLPRAIGAYKAAELVLTGRTMAADEAERAGLVSRIVPAAELLAEATRVGETIAAKSLPVVYAAKAALRAAQETTLAQGLASEKQAFTSAFALEDQTEGMAAFRDKRTPQFRHR
ncbi:enoyl-CoA hydratase-related protein [Microbacterium radiodurans]|uniref:Probable enoyl-CoA hydratase echA8 n=1 Tax=Microbacterium radiodurans TaxID=661398 RepID=A0A5J5IUL1_9MICO|nr:enoyl-CoA hydratase-related protein [Microbacterium radiodurans]KAA9089693.1 enoyl-CoA hydratase [Microbacterium radiodurans]